ncbi:MAG: nickel-dependent lactate racemase [Spirochaetes bacterium]|nr:nickel-dependent lactate racemase [Spirochaetota bacterium]
MKIHLAYGKDGIDVDVPDANLKKVLRMKEAKPVADVDTLMSQVLRNPIGCEPLNTIAKGRKNACVVITDVTRPTPNSIILPPLLTALEDAGLHRSDITILVATGTHEPNEGETLRGMVGDFVFKNYRIINHRSKEKKDMVDLGTTPAGSPVRINKHYVNADLKITTGLIEPHFMAGFSGGRKLICPGIAAAETVHAMHSPIFLEDARSKNGNLGGNPFHMEISEVARMAGGADFIVNVTIDEEKRITNIFAGDMTAAHQAGVAFVQSHAKDYIDAPADVVITTNSGYPLDLNFYQTVKGMVCALDVVREGGTIIIASRCHAGIGSDDFKKLLDGFTTPKAFLDMIHKPGFFASEQWEVEELCMALNKAKIMLYTEGISPDDISRYGVTPVSSVEDGIARCLKEYGPSASIAVIPKGPYVIAGVI